MDRSLAELPSLPGSIPSTFHHRVSHVARQLPANPSSRLTPLLPRSIYCTDLSCRQVDLNPACCLALSGDTAARWAVRRLCPTTARFRPVKRNRSRYLNLLPFTRFCFGVPVSCHSLAMGSRGRALGFILRKSGLQTRRIRMNYGTGLQRKRSEWFWRTSRRTIFPWLTSRSQGDWSHFQPFCQVVL
jgi:hypothetical protein